MSERKLAVQVGCSTRQFRSVQQGVFVYGGASTGGTNAVMRQQSIDRFLKTSGSRSVDD